MKIDFEFSTEYGVFRDALHLADDHKFTAEELAAMKQERLDNWLAIVNAPPVEAAPATVVEVPATLTIGGVEYTKLDGAPASGAKVVEVNGVWYQAV